MCFIPYFYDAPLKITCNYICHVGRSIIIYIIIYNITHVNSICIIVEHLYTSISLLGLEVKRAKGDSPALFPRISYIRKTPLAPFLCSWEAWELPGKLPISPSYLPHVK